MKDQLNDEPCSVHPGSSTCSIGDTKYNLLVMGTPCNPFSAQRTKRFHPESVMAHSLAEHTFQESFELLEKSKPINAVLEQSEGFSKPLATNTAETPMSRRLAWGESVSLTAFGM